jgi:hypothetical protein
MSIRISAWNALARTVVGTVVLTVCAAPLAPKSADAQAWHATVGVLTGSALLDPALAGCQWDTTPRASWGGQVLAGLGRFDAGVRMLSAETTQDLGLQGVASPRVHLTSLELVGQARILNLWGTRLHAIASVGRLRLDYAPDQLSFDPGGGGAPIVLQFRSVNEWIGGGGLALKLPVAEHWQLGVEVDHRVFSMETAHRNGSAIEYGRETFGEWNARLEFAWAYGRV